VGSQAVPVTSALRNADGYLASANFSLATGANFKMHASLATDGTFHILASKDGTGKFLSCFMASLLANFKTIEKFPLFVHMTGDVNLSQYYGYSSLGVNTISSCIMRAPDNSQGGNWGAVFPTTTYVPSAADSFDGSFVDLPLFVSATAIAYRSVRGRLQDVMYFGGGASTGSVDNPAGSPNYMVVGDMWFPCNAAPSL
jgi:hypothetical protein